MPANTAPFNRDALIPIDYEAWSEAWGTWYGSDVAQALLPARTEPSAAGFPGRNFLSVEELGAWSVSPAPGVRYYVELARVTFTMGPESRAYVGLTWTRGPGTHGVYEASLAATFAELERYLSNGPVPRAERPA